MPLFLASSPPPPLTCLLFLASVRLPAPLKVSSHFSTRHLSYLSTSTTGPTRPTGRLSVRIAGALRMSAKFGLILSHLISGGALLNHINAVDLLK